jgi:hypothetical protein
LQTSAGSQVCPHVPQFPGSVVVSTQVPAQEVRPGGHAAPSPESSPPAVPSSAPPTSSRSSPGGAHAPAAAAATTSSRTRGRPGTCPAIGRK